MSITKDALGVNRFLKCKKCSKLSERQDMYDDVTCNSCFNRKEGILEKWVMGIYYWSNNSIKDQRDLKDDYPRYIWCDIDNKDPSNLNAVVQVFKENNVNVITQDLGKGFHCLGDFVDYQTYMKIWNKIKPYADPVWPPHCIRLSKKREDELYERPVYYGFKSQEVPRWAKAVMHWMNKEIRGENPHDFRDSAQIAGLDKYFQIAVYKTQVKIN